MKKVLIPGSFDPLTYGHLDLIERALTLFDEVHIVIFTNFKKESFFSVNERIAFLKNNIKSRHAIITSYNGLSVQYAEANNIKGMIRGIRNVQDLDYEMQISQINAKLSTGLSTMWIPAAQDLMQISSSLLKELVSYGQDISDFVPQDVALACKERANEIG